MAGAGRTRSRMASISTCRPVASSRGGMTYPFNCSDVKRRGRTSAATRTRTASPPRRPPPHLRIRRARECVEVVGSSPGSDTRIEKTGMGTRARSDGDFSTQKTSVGFVRLHAWVAVGSISGLRGGPLDPGSSLAGLVVELDAPPFGQFGAVSGGPACPLRTSTTSRFSVWISLGFSVTLSFGKALSGSKRCGGSPERGGILLGRSTPREAFRDNHRSICKA